MAKTALIIDDSLTFRQMVVMALTDAKFTVIEACNGQDALDKLKGARVDIIISDVNMPVMDGITFVKTARAQPQLKKTPILMLTTESQPEMKQQGKAAGATGWIVKPFKAAHLIQVVSDLLP
ncbi:response regulator [Gemmata sp. G18]|uniref:Response regulator n=1 Tax=Gemmata palustris TaxID=2822762 RepID=A0ABS5BSM8_9BACT|nr:response regulator [Gemmata palustris]MBP3956733.1 response regulator [Gemmata palustris]